MLEEPVLPLADAALGVVAAGAAFALPKAPAAPAALSGEALLQPLSSVWPNWPCKSPAAALPWCPLKGSWPSASAPFPTWKRACTPRRKRRAPCARNSRPCVRSWRPDWSPAWPRPTARPPLRARRPVRHPTPHRRLGRAWKGREGRSPGLRSVLPWWRTARPRRTARSSPISLARCQREAARVIREEIAALAASMRDE